MIVRPVVRERSTRPEARRDLCAVAVGVVLVVAAVVVGLVLLARDVPIHAPVPPLRGSWHPHVGPGTPFACALAVLVVGYGPTLSRLLAWRRLLLAAWATSFAWVIALAMVDGWSRLTARLAKPGEYLAEVPGAPPWSELLRMFTERIVSHPDAWVTHVAGHPPGALGFFVLLDRVGLGGGAWAAVVSMVLGASACVAIAMTVRLLDGEQLARRAIVFLVLVPAALSIGVSADAVFLAVSAWGITLLALAIRSIGPRSTITAIGGGLLLGVSLYLSYGLLLVGAIALAVLIVGRQLRPLLVAGSAVVAVVVAFTAAGFVWWEAYDEVVVRYYNGWGGTRPFSYWVWANLAVLLICVGPAVAAGVRRVAVRPYDKVGTRAVVIGAAVAISVATLSGLSKGEVERIWLPFALWLVPACALLPPRTHRPWLAGQAVTALGIQHLLLTSW